MFEVFVRKLWEKLKQGVANRREELCEKTHT